jgi:arabinofuranosyltransferase
MSNRHQSHRTRKGERAARAVEETLSTTTHQSGTRKRISLGVPWTSAPLFLPVLIFFLLAIDYMWVTEDAFITFQSVENVWAGFGPNFNRGLRVESFSHPLWFLVLCMFRTGGPDMVPILAAAAGIALSVVGLFFATEAARQRFHGLPSLFPLGALMVAVLPPFWQFASSGLETGLTFFWIGFSSWCLVQMDRDASRWSVPTFFTLGLAPLIRPDLSVFALPLIVVAFMKGVSRPVRWQGMFCAVLCLLLPGSIWQVFRMGYYGALVPTTYIAKEGLGSRWEQGWLYLLDLVRPYSLLPVVVIAVLLLLYPLLKRTSQGPNQKPREYASVVGLIVGGVIHGTFVCRAGGDFMHARLLLPALFALATASAVVPLLFGRRLRITFLSVFFLWAGYVCLCARPPYASRISQHGIADERQWYVHGARTNRPVTLKDYSYLSFYRIGEGATQVLRQQGLKAIYWAHIGITVAVIPDDIIVIDPLALNDHIGARTELTERGRPGHEKVVPAEWFLARYPVGVGLVATNQLMGVFRTKAPQSSIDAAKAVLATPALMELHDAVAEPMNVRRFIKNIFRSWRLTFLRIPKDPQEALQKFAPK